MSLRVDAANYLAYGPPWDGAAYPGPNLPSTAGGFAACGLAIRTAIANGGSGAAFEPVLCMSGRYNAGGYFFTGWRNSNDIYADAGGGLSDVATDPALNTWFQWAISTNDPAGNLRFHWKYYGDAAWISSTAVGYGGQALLKRLFLGTDEYGSGSGGKVALANVRTWFKTKTAAALLDDVTSAALVDTAGIFAWWKLRPESPGLDSSGAGHDLTVFGAPDATGLPVNTLEAPSDTPAASTAVATGAFRRWGGGAVASVRSSGVAAGSVRRWGGGAVAGVTGGALAHAAGTLRRWTGAALASTIATGHAAGSWRRWRGGAVATSLPIADPDGGPIATGNIRRRSAMGAVQVAIDNALQLAPAFVALVGDRVYSLGTVPKDARAPWVELGDVAEYAANRFMRGGNRNEQTLTIVAPRAGGLPGVGAILAAMVDALDGRQLAAVGHRIVLSRLELITAFPDPDVAHTRAVCRYTVLSWTAA